MHTSNPYTHQSLGSWMEGDESSHVEVNVDGSKFRCDCATPVTSGSDGDGGARMRRPPVVVAEADVPPCYGSDSDAENGIGMGILEWEQRQLPDPQPKNCSNFPFRLLPLNYLEHILLA